MTTIPTLDQMRAIAEQAKTWPTVKEAATSCGVSVRTLDRAIGRGEIAYWRLNVTRIEPHSLAAWLAGRQK